MCLCVSYGLRCVCARLHTCNSKQMGSMHLEDLAVYSQDDCVSASTVCLEIREHCLEIFGISLPVHVIYVIHTFTFIAFTGS